MEDNRFDSKLVEEFDVGSPMDFDILNDPEDTFEEPPVEEPAAVETEEPVEEDVQGGAENTVEEEPNNDPPETDEDPYAEYTEAALMAEHYKREGIIPEDFEISKELTGQELSNLLLENTVNKLEQSKDAYYQAQGYTPEALEVASLMAQGIDPQVIWDAMQNRSLSSLEIEGEGEDVQTNRTQLIREMYKDKGLSDKRIQMLLEDLQDTAEDLEEAKVAKQYFEQKEQAHLEAEKKRIEQQKQLMKQQEEERISTIKNLIDQGDFYGIKVDSEKDKKELFDFLTTPDQMVKVPDEGGKAQVYRMTGYEKKLMEFQQDPKQQLAFARLLQMGFNLADIEQMAEQKVSDEILGRLNAKTTKKVQRRGGGGSMRGNNPQARPVAEFDI